MLLALTFILAGICTVLIIKEMVWESYGVCDSLFGKVMWTVIGGPICAAFMAFIIGLVFVLLPASLVDKPEEHYGQWDLQQINMGKNVKGRFFLGSGYVNEVATYTYYYKDGDNLRVGSWPAEDVLIVESNDVAPNINVTAENLPFWIDFTRTEWDRHATITVPENSIKPMVDMDLPDE